jgi:transposase InsO family protein
MNKKRLFRLYREEGLAVRRRRGRKRATGTRAPMALNEEVFATLAEARAVIERWRIDYNHVRPHSAHGGLTPEAVRLNPAAVRLCNLISSAARPLLPATQIGYQPPGLSE